MDPAVAGSFYWFLLPRYWFLLTGYWFFAAALLRSFAADGGLLCESYEKRRQPRIERETEALFSDEYPGTNLFKLRLGDDVPAEELGDLRVGTVRDDCIGCAGVDVGKCLELFLRSGVQIERALALQAFDDTSGNRSRIALCRGSSVCGVFLDRCRIAGGATGQHREAYDEE